MINCTQCGQKNSSGARFCNACGSSLSLDRDPSLETRKTVTVLFCDVVGSTELGERFDPEVLRGMMSRFYAAVREPVERHGGTVEKVIGDALVAVFGVPVVHEDDALRAVRAALEMRDAVLAAGEIQARIGVNTGDVLTRDATLGESLVVGDAVNVAARLEQAAGPGEVLVGEDTWALVGHAAHGEQVAPIAAKGKRKPLAAWRLLAVDPEAGGLRRRLDLPMIGRDDELELVRWAMNRTTRIQRPHLVTVLGQAGIGKSRLLAEVMRLRDDVTVLTGHCRSTAGSTPMAPWLEVARAAVSADRDGTIGIAELLPGDPQARAVAACLDPSGAAGSADVGWAVSRLIGGLASIQTVVVVLEDVHWAEAVLLDVVDQLLGRSEHRSLLVICTARPEFAEQHPGWGAGANTSTIAIERLNDLQTRELLTNASPDLGSDRADRVVEAAEGNPLFAEHLAALVGDHATTVGLPRSIQVLLTARLEALPPSEGEVVGVAAVAGREFPVAAVEALTGRPIPTELDHLIQRELIEPTVPGRCQFGHALLHEAAYGLISKQRRSELHTQLARWLDERGSDDALVGDHLERAYVMHTELGQSDAATARLGEEAGMRLAAAGRRADALGDPARARLLLERALNLLPEDSPLEAAAMIELAAAGWNLLSRDHVRGLLEGGRDLAASNGLRALELRAQILLLGTISEGDQDLSDDDIVTVTDAALRELERLDDPRAVASALCTRAESEAALGRAADAVVSTRRAIELLRAVDQDAVWALAILVILVGESPMPVSEAKALLGDLMLELGMRPTVRTELIVGQAVLAMFEGDTDGAWSLLESAQEIERDLGRETLRLSRVRALMLIQSDRLEEARVVLEMLVEELVRVSSVQFAENFKCWLGIVDARLGNLDAAHRAALSAHAYGERHGDYETSARSRLALSELALAKHEPSVAAELAREAVDIAVTGDWVVLQADARLLLARALSAAGEREQAVLEAEAARAVYQAKEHAPGEAKAAQLM